MTTAAKRLSYSEVLSYALQLSYSERLKLREEVMKNPSEMTWNDLFAFFEPSQDITEEEILAECEAARKEVYERSLKSCH